MSVQSTSIIHSGTSSASYFVSPDSDKARKKQARAKRQARWTNLGDSQLHIPSSLQVSNSAPSSPTAQLATKTLSSANVPLPTRLPPLERAPSSPQPQLTGLESSMHKLNLGSTASSPPDLVINLHSQQRRESGQLLSANRARLTLLENARNDGKEESAIASKDLHTPKSQNRRRTPTPSLTRPLFGEGQVVKTSRNRSHNSKTSSGKNVHQLFSFNAIFDDISRLFLSEKTANNAHNLLLQRNILPIAEFMISIPEDKSARQNFFKEDDLFALYSLIKPKTLQNVIQMVVNKRFSPYQVIEQMIAEGISIPNGFVRQINMLRFQNTDLSEEQQVSGCFTLSKKKQKMPRILDFTCNRLAHFYRSISELTLDNCNTGISTLRDLEFLPSLQKLSILHDSTMTDEALAFRSLLLRRMKKLDLSGCDHITTKTLEIVATGMNSQNLTDLTLTRTGIDSLKSIPRLLVLASLNLSGCKKINDKSLEPLHAAKMLKKLNVSHCSITDEGLLQLSKIQLLGDLTISHCIPVPSAIACCGTTNRITYNGVKEAFFKHPHLRILDVEGIRFSGIEKRALPRVFAMKIVEEVVTGQKVAVYMDGNPRPEISSN